MKKNLQANRAAAAVLAAALSLTLLVPVQTVNAASSKYVKKLTVSKGKLTINTDEQVKVTAKVAVKNSANKRISVSIDDKSLAKVSTKTGKTKNKSTITIKGKKSGTTIIKVTTVGRTSKGKQLSKKIKLQVLGTPRYNQTAVKQYINVYGGATSYNTRYITYKNKGNTYTDIYNAATNNLELTSTIANTKNAVTTKKTYQMVMNPDGKTASVTVTMTIQSADKSEYCKGHANINIASYNKGDIKFTMDANECSLSKASIQQKFNSGFKTSLGGWDYLTKDRMGYGLHGIGFEKLK